MATRGSNAGDRGGISRRHFVQLGAGALGAGALGWGSWAPAAAATVGVTVSFAPQTGGTSLSHAYAGLSFEKKQLSYPLLTSANASMVNAFNTLGPSVLRIGGASADNGTWDPLGTDGVADTNTRAGVDRLATFVQATGWRVLYALSLVNNTPAQMADEASYVSAQLGSSLFGFELCNEPDLYASTHPSEPTTFTGFQPVWEQYAAAVQAAAPGVPLTGPASSWNYKAYTDPFAAAESSRVKFLTQHYYKNPKNASIADLLTPDPSLPAELSALKSACPAGMRYRMAETNSYWSGGVAGVSNTHAAALWAINYLFTLASYGASGANFHCSGMNPYSPILVSWSGSKFSGVEPIYYGIYLFRQASHGTLMQTTVTGAPSTFQAFAVAGSSTQTSVVLVNTSGSDDVSATIACASGQTTATVLRMTGASLDSSTTTAINGNQVGADGTGINATGVTQQVVNQQVVLTVPAASAALVSLS